MRWRAAALTIALALCALLASVRLQAAPKQAVHIAIAAAPSDVVAMRRLVQELLAPYPVILTIEEVTEVDVREVATPNKDGAAALARVWLDLTGPQHATVYVVDAPWERVLIRHVPSKGEPDEVTREQLAHITASAVEALLAGGRILVRRKQVQLPAPLEDAQSPTVPRAAPGVAAARPPPLPPPVMPSPQAEAVGDQTDDGSVVRAGLGVFYAASTLSAGGPLINGPGASIAMRAARGDFQPGGWFSAQFRLPAVAGEDRVEVEYVGTSLRLMAGTDYRFDAPFSLRAGVGAGADIDRVTPSFTRIVSGQLAPARVQLAAMMRVMAMGRLHASRRMAIELSLGLDVGLTSRRLVADVAGREVVIIDPWVLRPVLALGISGELLGSAGLSQ